MLWGRSEVGTSLVFSTPLIDVFPTDIVSEGRE